MKKLLLIFALASSFCFTACDDENEGVIYKSSDTEFTFMPVSSDEVGVKVTGNVFDVEVVRSSAEGAQSLPVSIKVSNKGGEELSGYSVSNASFTDGQIKTLVTVDITPLEVGADAVTVALSFEAGLKSPSGSSKALFSVTKNYNWQSIGKGTYIDNFIVGEKVEVEILKAEGFDRWRAVLPYESFRLAGDLGGTSSSDVEFWSYGEDGAVRFDDINTGEIYEDEGDKYIIWALPYYRFSSLTSDRSMWLNEKTVQLAPYYYMKGLGGWNKTQSNGYIVITLP